MTAKKIKLISPENEGISGLLLENGSVFPVAFMYDKELMLSDIVLQGIPPSSPKKAEGQSIYVDKKGAQWNALDVECHSVLNSGG